MQSGKYKGITFMVMSGAESVFHAGTGRTGIIVKKQLYRRAWNRK